jgi:hypothetical protein
MNLNEFYELIEKEPRHFIIGIINLRQGVSAKIILNG